MLHPFNALAGEYTSLLAAMVVDPRRVAQVEGRARIILEHAAAQDYRRVILATGVPQLWAMASF